MKYFAKFENIFNYTRRICTVIGIDILRDDFKFTWRTACLFFVASAGIGVTLYTAYVEAILEADYYKLFITGAVIGSAIQGSAKASIGFRKRDDFRFIYAQIKEMYERHENKKSLSYQEVLKYNITLVKKLLATIFAIVTLVSVVVIMVPIFTLFFLKARLEILPFKIPFLNAETDIGFYLTSVSHIACVMVATYGNFVCDSWLFMFVAHIPLMKNIMKCKFEELNDIAEANPRDIKKSIGPLLGIIKWHQKYNIYCSAIKKTFFWIIFIQIVTEFFGIASNIVCIFLGIWPPASVVTLYLFAMIYSYCVLGNLVEMSNDEITIMIYDCCWYNLTVVEQKLILIMLRESQNASGIPIGGVAPLSLNTALQLTKTIYTFSMMLKEFFK